jgi:hypothetical protein
MAEAGEVSVVEDIFQRYAIEDSVYGGTRL